MIRTLKLIDHAEGWRFVFDAMGTPGVRVLETKQYGWKGQDVLEVTFEVVEPPLYIEDTV